MKIKIKQDCLYGVVENYDEENDEVNEVDDTFRKDEIFDGDLVDDYVKYINFQFPDGSMVFGLKKEHFEIIEAD